MSTAGAVPVSGPPEEITQLTVVSADPRRYQIDAEGRAALVATRCRRCQTAVFGTHRACLACASPQVHRAIAVGRGTVLSYTIIHRASSDWSGHVPYLLAEVETDDHVVVVASVIEEAGLAVPIGARVDLRETRVEHPSGGSLVAIYQWAPGTGHQVRA
jgi:uncharacterized OB-fold protein